MSSRHRVRRRERKSRSRSPDFGQRERTDERSRQSREESDSDRQNNRQGNSKENGERRTTRDPGSPERKKSRHEKRNFQSQRDSESSGDRQDNRNKRDNIDSQSNETSGHDREAFLGNPEEDTSQPKEEPNFELSGKLAEYTNTYKGVVIKYNEPPEALKPKTRWRLYPFKGDQSMSVLYVHRQSAYLIGRQRHIVDLAVDHPSCSKQHAVLQYRLVSYERDDGSAGRKCKPYIIDLESANGTFLNNQKIEARRYYELKEKDVLKFGFSSREYVLLHEKTKGSEVDDDDISEEQPQQES